MSKQSKFEELVMFLAENSECGNAELDEEITKFEDAIERTGNGIAYFGTAKSNWDSIEIVRPEHIPPAYKRDGVLYYAEYYDGMQAPFTVCKWSRNFDELEELLKDTSDVLYQKYQEILH